ncbi:MAG: hypothetical protein Q8Q05_00285 [bacterium]|nr:hypothetical protein [bacterium]
MGILLKIAILILGLGVGTALVKYSFQLTQIFGRNSLAEQYLGNGGSYTMWKMLGLIIIFGSIWYVFG